MSHLDTGDSGTTIDTPTNTQETYSTQKSTHTKTRIRIPKKLKQQIETYSTEGGQSYTQYSEYSVTPSYSNTYGYSATQNSNQTGYSGYTPTYGPTGTYSYTGTTGYSENPSQTQSYSYSQNPTYSYTNTTGYSYSQTNPTYSYTNQSGSQTNPSYSYTASEGATGTGSYTYSKTGTQNASNTYSKTGTDPNGTNSSFSYTVFTSNPISTSEVETSVDAPSVTYTTDDSVTKRVRVKVRVPKKGNQKTMKREAARVLMHRNGAVLNTDVHDESVDAVSLDPAGTSDLSTLDLPSAMEVPYIETVKPVNAVKKPKWDDEDDSTLTQMAPEPQNFGRPLIGSRFLGRNQLSSSDDESQTNIDTITTQDETSESTIPTVMNREEFQERFSAKSRSVAAVPAAEDGGFAQAEMARQRMEEKMAKKQEYKAKVAEAIRNGESPPPTLTTTATDELSTLEKDIRLELEMQQYEEDMKKNQMTNEQRQALFPASRRGKFVKENPKKLMFASDSDSVEEDDLNPNPVVFEVGNSYNRTNIAQISKGMGLFDSMKPMKLEDIKTYEPDTGEYNALKEAEEARRQAEMERKIAEMRKMKEREISTTDTYETNFSTTTSTELAEISPQYLPKKQGGIPEKAYERNPAVKFPPPPQFDPPKKNRPSRGSRTATTTTSTNESAIIEEVHEYFTNTDSNNSSTPNPTVLVTANSSSADYVEAPSNAQNAMNYVEVTQTNTNTNTHEEDNKKKQRPKRGNKNSGPPSYTSNNLTTVTELRTANPTSADFVEASANQNGELYVEVPASTATNADDLTTGHSEYVTATSNATGSLYVVDTDGARTESTYTYITEEEEDIEEEEIIEEEEVAEDDA
ncbi:hypothetical protein TVAG_091600 [Trichomonas vaginalis G3]|uniref:Uncharacterized protein n=1 Tax=Trichomonas vaginalis (strain ATCC PRA-98 / G3) TaxID=412133 RepID=A2FYP8_TRIV3|nr:hypothetical protein TVAGG3_0160570 [Trichomonas vaginalis G3]EAX89970.1 hypothetical protein TVAG_091600 [Trichomonas vaginalis G3]KAI5547840.1 hypothetical protein TVAGG3_0160570 [Trichomonas vaginalis G3]|eukprot:XP_001302900.1 hypothetical protein [Trichomonas vaginalis G3]